MKTNTLPPKTIYNVLHQAEAAGVKIPKDVDRWWTIETDINMRSQLTPLTNNKQKHQESRIGLVRKYPPGPYD